MIHYIPLYQTEGIKNDYTNHLDGSKNNELEKGSENNE